MTPDAAPQAPAPRTVRIRLAGSALVAALALLIAWAPSWTGPLREAWFVKGGSVSTGSYTEDEPSSGDDPRVIAFGEVPAIVYSETLAELAAISGKAADDDE